MNDTTRQVGGALGVAVIGSVTASIYSSRVTEFLHGKPLPSGTAHEVEQSLGVALAVGKQVPGLATTANDAFIAGLHVGMWVAAGVALVGRGDRVAVAARTRATDDAPIEIPAEAPDIAVGDPQVATST